MEQTNTFIKKNGAVISSGAFCFKDFYSHSTSCSRELVRKLGISKKREQLRRDKKLVSHGLAKHIRKQL